jgi:hypothetical protein
MNQLRPTIISFLRPGRVFPMELSISIKDANSPAGTHGCTKAKSTSQSTRINNTVSSNTINEHTSNPTGSTKRNALRTTFSTPRRTDIHLVSRGTQVRH